MNLHRAMRALILPAILSQCFLSSVAMEKSMDNLQTQKRLLESEHRVMNRNFLSKQENAKKDFCNVPIQKIYLDTILTVFETNKPSSKDIDLYLETVKQYADYSKVPPVEAISYLFSLTKYLEDNRPRVCWFVKQVMDKVISENQATAMDYVSFGAIRMREVSPAKISTIPVDVSTLEFEIYQSFTKALELGLDNNPKHRIECYLYLAEYTFRTNKFDECILHTEEFLKLNSVYHVWDLSTGIGQFAIFSLMHKWAQSLFHCGHFLESLELYKAILGDEHLYLEAVKSTTLEELAVLYSLYMSLSSEEDRKAIQKLLNLTANRLSADFFKKLHGSQKKQKQKNNNREKILSQKVVEAYILDQKKKAHEIYCLVKNIDIEAYKNNQKTYDVDENLVEKIMGLIDEISRLHNDSQKREDNAAKIRSIHQKMGDSHRALEALIRRFKEKTRCKIRSILLKEHNEADLDIVPMEINSTTIKAEVLKNHSNIKMKKKTHSSACENITEPVDAKIVEEEEELAPINSIISCKKEVLNILASQEAGDYPPNTVNLLNILNESQNIDELRRNLGLFAADLKELKNEQKWSFRINNKYRIRFMTSKEGFTNVEIGDFHIRGK